VQVKFAVLHHRFIEHKTILRDKMSAFGKFFI